MSLTFYQFQCNWSFNWIYFTIISDFISHPMDQPYATTYLQNLPNIAIDGLISVHNSQEMTPMIYVPPQTTDTAAVTSQRIRQQHVPSMDQSLKRRVRTRNYKCDFCQKDFTDNNNLQRHIRTHTGDKPFICELCNRGFASRSNLNSHKVTHFTYGYK